MNMKKTMIRNIGMIIIAIIMSVIMTGSAYAAAMEDSKSVSVEEFRTTSGVLTYKTYHEDTDSYSMELVTIDGNVWEVEDYVCNLFTNCVVTFDTNGTESIEDDIIVEIITRTVFD